MTQLRDLEMALEQAGEELFAVVPFAGDDLTGAVINGYVDRTVADLRNLQSRVAQLRQVLHLAARSSADPSGQEDRR